MPTRMKDDNVRLGRPKRSDGRGPRAAPDWVLTNFDVETTHSPNLEDELRRLQVLRTILPLVSSKSDERSLHDNFAREATDLLQAPIGRVTLVDLGQTVQIGLYGAFEQQVDIIPTTSPRRESFCAHTVLSKNGILIVPDASVDKRFAQFPDVEQHHIRFYAGIALVIDGAALGVLSVFDTKPRHHDDRLGLERRMSELQDTVALRISQHWMDIRRSSSEPQSSSRASSKEGETTLNVSSPPESISLKSLILSQTKESPKLRQDTRMEEEDHQYQPSSPLPSIEFRSPLPMLPSPSKVEIRTNRSTSSFNNSTDDDLYGGDNVPITNLVRGLELIAQVASKKVDVIFRVCQKLLDLEQSIDGDDHLRLSHEALLFRAVATILTAACHRTSSGFVAITIQTAHKSDKLTHTHHHQLPCLEIECEDTAGTLLPSEVFEHPSAMEVSSSSFLYEHGGVPTTECNNGVWESDSICCVSRDLAKNIPDFTRGEKSASRFNPCSQQNSAVVPDLHVVPRYMKVMHGEFGIRPRTKRYESDQQVGSVVWLRVPFIQ